MKITKNSIPPTCNRKLHDFFGLMFLILSGILVYSSSLNAPWYFDDITAIVENPIVRDLDRAWQEVFTKRGIATLSFAVNYQLGGMEVVGFHLTNLFIHLLTAGTVFYLAKRVFPDSLWQQLIVALIFVAHPLQTQAVTYVVQRMTSLAGLFFFLSIYLYLRYLEGTKAINHKPFFHKEIFYLLAFLCGAAAVLTKENTAVLPLALLLFERYFMPGRGWRRQLVSAVPFCLVPAWVAIQVVLPVMSSGTNFAAVAGVQKLSSLSNLSPVNYLVTEFSVLWLYLKLLFFPVGQALEYAYPVVEKILLPQNVFAFIGLLGLAGLGWWLRRRRRVLSFGIFWFFLALLVESSFIPLDPVFEHRLYLAMFGFALVLVDLASLSSRKRMAVCLLALVVMVFGILAWQRNAMWNDPIAFYQDNLERHPDSERVMNCLATSYASKGESAKAEILYRKSLQLNPSYWETYRNLGKILIDAGRWDEAYETLNQGLLLNPQSQTLHNSLGVVYSHRGDKARAVEAFQNAINLDSTRTEGYFNLGIVYMEMGKSEMTEKMNRKVLSLFPENGQAHYNLGIVYFYRQEFQAARDAFTQAHLNRYNGVNTLYNLALSELKLGNHNAVLAILPELSALDPDLGSQMRSKMAGIQSHGSKR